MKNLKIHGELYKKMFIKDENYIIKYSLVKKPAWEKLKSKKLSFINEPLKIKELKTNQKQTFEDETAILLPFLKEYETLGNSKKLNTLTTEELLKLMQRLTNIIKQMHKKQIYHTDLHSNNIMINEKGNIKLIDFEAMMIEKYISKENIYYEDYLTLETKQNLSIIEDKLSIISLMLYYLKNQTFKSQLNDYINPKTLNLPKEIEKEINGYQRKLHVPKKDYYFEDMIETLLKQGYEMPKNKKWIKKKKTSHYINGGKKWKK